MAQELSRTKKFINGVFDGVKGFCQILTFSGGAGGFVAGFLYGVVDGIEDKVNGKKFSWTKTFSCAFSGVIPVVGPLLIGGVGSSVDQIQSGNKLNWKESLMSAIPFLGPILAGAMFRNKRLAQAQLPDAPRTPAADVSRKHDRGIELTAMGKSKAKQLEDAARAAGTAARGTGIAEATDGVSQHGTHAAHRARSRQKGRE